MTHFAETATPGALPLAEAARIVREAEAVRDKSYRQYSLGQEWGRFLRSKRMAGCAENTLLSYETVGRLFTLRHADFASLEPFAAKETGPELVLDFLERNWGEADPDTLDQRTAVMRSFFEWAYRTDRISADPMRKIEKRRRRQQGRPRRQRIPAGPLSRLVAGQDTCATRRPFSCSGASRCAARIFASCKSLMLTSAVTSSTCATQRAERSTSSRSAFPTCARRSTCTCRRRSASPRSSCSMPRPSAHVRSHAPASTTGSVAALNVRA